MFNETWADQYARLLRSHRRLQRALTSRSEPADSDYQELDALYHFCCDALNLRDWIKNDLPQHARGVSRLIRRSNALSACAEIAYGSKQAAVTQTIYTSGGPATVAQKGTHIIPSPNPPAQMRSMLRRTPDSLIRDSLADAGVGPDGNVAYTSRVPRC